MILFEIKENQFLRKSFALIFAGFIAFSNIGVPFAVNDFFKDEPSGFDAHDAQSFWIFFLSKFLDISDSKSDYDPDFEFQSGKYFDAGVFDFTLKNHTNLSSFKFTNRCYLSIKATKFQRLFLLYHCLKIAIT